MAQALEVSMSSLHESPAMGQYTVCRVYALEVIVYNDRTIVLDH